jgi:hypothetical protein
VESDELEESSEEESDEVSSFLLRPIAIRLTDPRNVESRFLTDKLLITF